MADDLILKILKELEEALKNAWQAHNDPLCPLGELAALAAAARACYEERQTSPIQHWSHAWERQRERSGEE